MSTTYIFHDQAGIIPGTPGTFSNCTVTVDATGSVTSINGLPQVPVPTTNAVALVSPPANATANVDTVLTFAAQVAHVEIQNNSAFDVYVAYAQAATNGSLRLPPNGVLLDDIQTTTVHLLTAAATAVNGNSEPNIYVGGLSQ